MGLFCDCQGQVNGGDTDKEIEEDIAAKGGLGVRSSREPYRLQHGAL